MIDISSILNKLMYKLGNMYFIHNTHGPTSQFFSVSAKENKLYYIVGGTYHLEGVEITKNKYITEKNKRLGLILDSMEK